MGVASPSAPLFAVGLPRYSLRMPVMRVQGQEVGTPCPPDAFLRYSLSVSDAAARRDPQPLSARRVLGVEILEVMLFN